MRFVLILVILGLVVAAGLYVYGEMLEPKTNIITEEARDGAE